MERLKKLLVVILRSAGIVLLSLGIIVMVYERHFSYEAMERHYQEMYERIGVASGQIYPRLEIQINDSINAYSDGNKLVLFTGMIDFVNDDDMIASVLGHELAHHHLRHSLGRPSSNELDDSIISKQNELHADKLGAFYMMAAGYDICKGREIYKKFKDGFGDPLEAISHPNHQFRYDSLYLPMCE